MGTTILSNPFVQILLVIVVPIILYISKYEVYPSIKQNLGIKDEEEPDKGGTWIVITGFSVLAVILAIFAGVKSGIGMPPAWVIGSGILIIVLLLTYLL